MKLWTWGPFFRHEAPQAGRFRQFTQVDAEALGSDDPSLDAELILLLGELIERTGAGPARLRLSSLGTPETRAAYLDELRAYLREHEDELSEEVRERLGQNPLRAFVPTPSTPGRDGRGAAPASTGSNRAMPSTSPRSRPARRRRPRVRGRLHLGARPRLLHADGVRVPCRRDCGPAALAAGGRYDLLVEELGGPPTPGVGWWAGIERLLLALEAEPEPDSRVYIALARPPRDGRASDWPAGCAKGHPRGDRAGGPLDEGAAQAG